MRALRSPTHCVLVAAVTQALTFWPRRENQEGLDVSLINVSANFVCLMFIFMFLIVLFDFNLFDLIIFG